MYILIEHSGSPEQNKIVKNISEHLDHEYGITCDYAITHENSGITLYDEDMKPIVEFTKNPEKDLLDFYVRNYLEES